MGYVLIIDDDVDLADALALLIGGMGFRVETAHSGHEALAQVRRELPRLVLSDVRMPEGNGLELFRSLRALPGGARIPFAFVSGYLSSDDSDLAKLHSDPAGFAFFTKPLDMPAFIAFLRGFREA